MKIQKPRNRLALFSISSCQKIVIVADVVLQLSGVESNLSVEIFRFVPVEWFLKAFVKAIHLLAQSANFSDKNRNFTPQCVLGRLVVWTPISAMPDAGNPVKNQNVLTPIPQSVESFDRIIDVAVQRIHDLLNHG